VTKTGKKEKRKKKMENIEQTERDLVERSNQSATWGE